MGNRDRIREEPQDGDAAEDALRDDRAERDVAEPPHPSSRFGETRSHTARTRIRKPTLLAMSRCVCSKRIPPTIFSSGNVNMFQPYVVGQSGTDRPDPVLVTRPPAKISTAVETATSTA